MLSAGEGCACSTDSPKNWADRSSTNCDSAVPPCWPCVGFGAVFPGVFSFSAGQTAAQCRDSAEARSSRDAPANDTPSRILQTLLLSRILPTVYLRCERVKKKASSKRDPISFRIKRCLNRRDDSTV